VQGLYQFSRDILSGMSMQRNDAISYLKELLGTSSGVSPDAISIEEQENHKTVRIRIKTNETERIKDMARERNLSIKEESDSIIIFA
jgi:hypothetical protein